MKVLSCVPRSGLVFDPRRCRIYLGELEEGANRHTRPLSCAGAPLELSRLLTFLVTVASIARNVTNPRGAQKEDKKQQSGVMRHLQRHNTLTACAKYSFAHAVQAHQSCYVVCQSSDSSSVKERSLAASMCIWERGGGGGGGMDQRRTKHETICELPRLLQLCHTFITCMSGDIITNVHSAHAHLNKVATNSDHVCIQ